MLTLLAILVDGLVYSSWLFIVAVGLSLIFGVMKILNVAHGGLYAFGAYGAATLIGAYFNAGWPPLGGFAMIFLAALGMGLLLGLILERGLLRFMYGRDEVIIVLVTYAAFLISEDVILLVWGPSPYFAFQPYSLLGTTDVGILSFANYDLMLIGLSLVGQQPDLPAGLLGVHSASAARARAERSGPGSAAGPLASSRRPARPRGSTRG